MLRGAVALLPVLAFLSLLMLLDSFKLVRPRALAQTLLAGALLALLTGEINGPLASGLRLPPEAFSRYVAPVVEELLKSLWIVVLIQRRRLGFLVDAAIQGFAVGTGFALVENVDSLRHLPDAGLGLWLARGFGTAMLHGAATSAFAILSLDRAERSGGLGAFGPGWAVAIGVHSLFNHFVLPPLVSALVLLATLPLLLIFVFERSERATRGWLGAGLDSDVELLGLITTGRVGGSRLGSYLESLKARFPALVVADMLCLLQIHAELSLRAKGLVIARQAGLALPVGEDVRASLQELRYLEESVGPTGLLAMKPIHRQTSRDLWQIYMLSEAGTPA